ncbi:MAG: prepilin-type N-terminal cleavage/methylation domain-containing protein [Gammaproteobacteria bacterium]|nr:prepilin-type N-terminal cleavage/methylation domain-containing protein [Gammaproteobacteria bacterium]
MKRLILVTGTSIRKRGLQCGPRQGGFTLFELLIVVAIIAITISVVQLAPGLSDETRDLKRVGKELGKLFRLLNQEAVFERRVYAISVQEKGFIVLEYAEDKWAPTVDSFFKKIKMTESQRSTLIIENQTIDISETSEPTPHILIEPSGEMTPFEWHIEDKLTKSGIVLQGNFLGGVMMTGPEPLT